jgi:hypothetical protein
VMPNGKPGEAAMAANSLLDRRWGRPTTTLQVDAEAKQSQESEQQAQQALQRMKELNRRPRGLPPRPTKSYRINTFAESRGKPAPRGSEELQSLVRGKPGCRGRVAENCGAVGVCPGYIQHHQTTMPRPVQPCSALTMQRTRQGGSATARRVGMEVSAASDYSCWHNELVIRCSAAGDSESPCGRPRLRSRSRPSYSHATPTVRGGTAV